MKKYAKRILSVLLALALVLSAGSFVDLSAYAAGTRTVYFENTDNWSVVNIYYWSSSNTNYVSWPGVAMKAEGENIFSFDLPDGVEYVIFNNGSTQTGDLTLPADQNLYSYASGQWSTHGCLHNWGEETVLTEATCTEAGEATYTCSVCNETKTVSLDALGHSYQIGTCIRCGHTQPVIFFNATGSNWDTVYAYTWGDEGTFNGAWPGENMEVVDAAARLYCIAVPSEAVNIIFNNGNGGDGNQTADLTIPTDGNNLYTFSDGSWSDYDTCAHEWGEGEITTEATCTVDGVRTYTCSLCGEVKTEAVTAIGHSYENGSCIHCGALQACTEHVWDEGVVTEEQGCWTPGTRTYTCTLCGTTKEEMIYAGHDRYVAEIIEPTCTKTGKEITKCTRCAYSYDRTLPKIDHSYVAGEKVAPTCMEDGYTIYTCSACGATTNGDLVYHTGHSWSGNTCVTCGAVCEHTYQDGICTACGNGGPAYVEGYYEIANAAQLYWFAAQVNSGNNAINGKLVADIDLENGTWTSIGYYCSDTLSPDTVPYTGKFDGQGHTVSNFVTAGTDNEGLFGYCSSATISNVGVVGATVTGWRGGAVAGYPLTSNVTNCFAKDCTIIGKTSNSVATLSGSVYIAPVASPQGGIVRNCYALNCTLVDDTDLEVYTSPVGGTDTQNGYYCNTVWEGEFSSVRNSTEVTEAQLASGEVTWLLNKGVTDGTQGWYQTCGQGLPAHSGDTVYQITGCGEANSFYTNDPDAESGHSYNDGVVTTEPGCTTTGVKTFTCTGCADSYEESIPALGHSYEEGKCVRCGEADPDYVPEITTPEIAMKYPSLSFEDVIVLNVYYSATNIEDVAEMGLITYSEKVTEYGVDTAEHVIPGYAWSESDQFYYSTTTGIAPKDIGDTIYFAVYYKLTDGTYGYTSLVGYSPKTYAYNQLQSGSAEMRPLVVAMLNYGAAAQTYFGYKTDALMNADLTADQAALVEAYSDSMIATVTQASGDKLGQFVNDKTYTKRYPTISFEGAFCINYYFQPSQTVAGDVMMYIWSLEDYEAAEVLTKENATKAVKMELTETGEYLAVLDGIAAKDLDKAAYVTFCYSDGTTDYCGGVLGYTIGMYCKSQASKTGTLADLAKACAVYGYYAKQLFNK